jgi:hypothetical protein
MTVDVSLATLIPKTGLNYVAEFHLWVGYGKYRKEIFCTIVNVALY